MKLSILLFALLFVVESKSQTFSEWFKQKKTQTKYSLAQIAALQAYTDVLGRGYKVVKDGLQVVGDIKNGDFNLHKNYFSSLETVNPAVKNTGKVSSCNQLQKNILLVYSRMKGELAGNKWLNEGERQYVKRVGLTVLENCAGYMDELHTLTSNGELALKDDERLAQLNSIHSDMENIYSFLQSFSNGVRLLSLRRQKEFSDNHRTKLLYGINAN